jgi:phosphoenolpyruvate-protein kinase (PTS system EI component)
MAELDAAVLLMPADSGWAVDRFPAAVMVAELLARVADFFSVGHQ